MTVLQKETTMALSPRELIQQQIRRKTARTKEIRQQQADRTKPEERIFRFLTEFDESYRNAKTDTERGMLIQSEPASLRDDLSLVDSNVRIELVWFGDEEGDLKNLRIDGVRVFWGDAYRVANGLVSDEQLFDLSALLFR
jgi:hypothetical protein